MSPSIETQSPLSATVFEQFTATLTKYLELVCKDVKAVVKHELAKGIKTSAVDVGSMREMIKANAIVLFPILNGGGTSSSSTRDKSLSTVHIITSGAAPSIQALVLYGGETSANKVELMVSDKAPTAAEAYEKLLDLSGRLVELKLRDNRRIKHVGYAVKMSGGTYYSNDNSDSPLAAEDEVWWGGETKPEPSPAFSADSFRSDRSFKSAHTGASFGSDCTTDDDDDTINMTRSFKNGLKRQDSFVSTEGTHGSATHANTGGFRGGLGVHSGGSFTGYNKSFGDYNRSFGSAKSGSGLW